LTVTSCCMAATGNMAWPNTKNWSTRQQQSPCHGVFLPGQLLGRPWIMDIDGQPDRLGTARTEHGCTDMGRHGTPRRVRRRRRVPCRAVPSCRHPDPSTVLRGHRRAGSCLWARQHDRPERRRPRRGTAGKTGRRRGRTPAREPQRGGSGERGEGGELGFLVSDGLCFFGLLNGLLSCRPINRVVPVLMPQASSAA